MSFAISPLVKPTDLSWCVSLMLQSNPWDKLYFTKEQCEADLARPEMSVHGAIQGDGTILGFVASLANGIDSEPMIEYLCVDPRHRGKGIGSRLIRHFEEVLFPAADNLYLFVSDINPDAARLYIRLGYLQVGAFPNFNLEMQTEFLHRKSRRPRQYANMLANK